MGEYVTSKKDMKFQSLDALKTVQSVIDETDLALQDKSRGIEDSPLSEVLAGAVGAGVGAGAGFAALYMGGTVAGVSAAGITSGLAAAGSLIGVGMVAGIGVLAAPAVILGGAGVGIASHAKNKKLRKRISILECCCKADGDYQGIKGRSLCRCGNPGCRPDSAWRVLFIQRNGVL